MTPKRRTKKSQAHKYDGEDGDEAEDAEDAGSGVEAGAESVKTALQINS
tara:strand:- start:261 stop:407 length:147 start_codon:yes stop_codon:yes gene_type:complete